ncbi:MAG: outer membrane lipoprotein-sorting protein [Bryobacteraceae bacterium]
MNKRKSRSGVEPNDQKSVVYPEPERVRFGRAFQKFIAALAALPLLAQDPRELVKEVERRAKANSQLYEGALTVTDAKSRVTEKRWQYSRLGSFGDSKAVLRFTAPAEVKGVAILIHNHMDRASDQWMWTPALHRDRRIALQDRSTRFFGTDFSFEDLEERDANQFQYKVLGEETIDGKKCWKLESTPVEGKRSQYTHSHVWVRQDIYVFVRIDAFKKEKLVRRIEYRNFEQVKNIWTARSIEVFDAARNSRTVLKFDKLDYNVPLDESQFTLQSLRRG